jgi:hypothetical protein
MQRRSLLSLAAAAALAPRAANAARGPVLVELFTSQGCSSCPSADAAFAGLLQRPDLIPIAFHVTYWDRLGWRDTLGDAAFTDRQQWYAGLLGKGLYTPQLLLGGELDLVGSDPRLDQALTLVQDRRATLWIDISAAGVALLPEAEVTGEVRLTAIGYDRLHQVAIERGENAGSSVDYYNAARSLADLGAWDGMSRRLALGPSFGSGVVLLAQDQATGRVIALGRREPVQAATAATTL